MIFGFMRATLIFQPVDAGVLLLGQRVAVLGRPALDDVGDVDIPFPVEVDGLEHFIEQLAAAADEGLSLEVFVLAGALADEQYLGRWDCPRRTRRWCAFCTARIFHIAGIVPLTVPRNRTWGVLLCDNRMKKTALPASKREGAFSVYHKNSLNVSRFGQLQGLC